MAYISVIIPVYQVEKYVRRCIESVINQTYRDIEIILVDDGSRDESGRICDEYAAKDQRINVIHKENGGLSDARNKGVAISRAEYIQFIDGDDYLLYENALRDIVEVIKEYEVDVLNFGFKAIDSTNGKVLKEWLPYTNDKTVYEVDPYTMLRKNSYRSSACMKIVRSDIVKDIPPFEINRLSEDIIWSAQILSKANTFANANKYVYGHVRRPGSITNSVTSKSCIDLVHSIDECIQIASSLNGDKQAALYRYTAYQLGTFYITQALADYCPEECMAFVESNTWLLEHHNYNRKLFVLNVMTKVVGFRSTCKLIRMIKS